VAPPAAAPTALIAAPAATTVATTISVASSLSSSVISAPMLPRAANAAAGFVNAVSSNAAGFCTSSTCAATSAVITRAFPFSSVLTSTGVDAGRSEYETPAALISAAEIDCPGARFSINFSTTISFCASVSLPSSDAFFNSSASAFAFSASAAFASASAFASFSA